MAIPGPDRPGPGGCRFQARPCSRPRGDPRSPSRAPRRRGGTPCATRRGSGGTTARSSRRGGSATARPTRPGRARRARCAGPLRSLAGVPGRSAIMSRSDSRQSSRSGQESTAISRGVKLGQSFRVEQPFEGARRVVPAADQGEQPGQPRLGAFLEILRVGPVAEQADRLVALRGRPVAPLGRAPRRAAPSS